MSVEEARNKFIETYKKYTIIRNGVWTSKDEEELESICKAIEVKSAKHALLITCIIYSVVAVVIVGLVFCLIGLR